MSLEQYAIARNEFRQRVIAHKKLRQIALGPNTRLCFEDRLTMLYQIQEILRIERAFEVERINEELEAFNPMIPNGRNFKATFMLEYSDAAIRAVQLEKLVGIEDHCWMQIGDSAKVWSIADEDIDRSSSIKTSAVHFLRFEIPNDATLALQSGADWTVGVQHPNYNHETAITGATRASLLGDLD